MIVVGLFLIWQHAHSWRTQRDSGDHPPKDLAFFQRLLRRRLQTSGLLVFIGVLIIAGDLWLTDRKAPFLFAAWVVVLLLLISWVVLLALGDFVSIRAHSQAALSEVRMHQIALEQEAEQLRSRIHGNGNGKKPLS